ncbi:hypothetical protein BB561_006923, partial [Smittium simulii]
LQILSASFIGGMVSLCISHIAFIAPIRRSEHPLDSFKWLNLFPVCPLLYITNSNAYH